MKTEKAYEFRKKLINIHNGNIRKKTRRVCENEFMLNDLITISVHSNPDDVTLTAIEDFIDYSKRAMGITASYSFGEKGDIIILPPCDPRCPLGEADTYRGFAIDVKKSGITICAHDNRGTAQALYYLEDVMSMEAAPVFTLGVTFKYPAFSPQMVHSGYGLDEYPDEYLLKIAHEGRDAILVFTKDVNLTPGGYLDFNDLIRRAGRFGIDVYAYSYLISDMSPHVSGSYEYYEKTYGRLFRECPGLKGVTLVGESVEFPSRDPNVSPGKCNMTDVDGIPTGKVTAGWYPCEDYPQWINLIKKVIRKYRPDADIVFWTYNWGYQSEEARIRLIQSLPDDISLMATFEMFEPRMYNESIGKCADYTLSFEGPGKYFTSEAVAAAKRGIRLYSMTNTGGLTWDIGVIPYEPMPYQWMRRYENMRKAHREWGLCGIMETHHYGFYPSFISKLAKWSFWKPFDNMEIILKKILISEFGEENYEKVNDALLSWSEAIRYFVPSDADQYGAFRVGPSYPFCFERKINIPSDDNAMFGSSICCPVYSDGIDSRVSPLSVRIYDEIDSLEKMRVLIKRGIDILCSCMETNENLLTLINLGKFIHCVIRTGINAKKWHILKSCLKVEISTDLLLKIIDDMEMLLNEEIDNANEAIKFVEYDSRLGWEPSMLYMTDRWHLEWKIRQVNYVLEKEIGEYKKSIIMHDLNSKKLKSKEIPCFSAF